MPGMLKAVSSCLPKFHSLCSGQSATIGHIVMIAGPSCSGKSTFVSELRRKSVPNEVAKCLPSQVHLWKQLYAGQLQKKDLHRLLDTDAPLGLLVQYDLMRCYTKCFAEYNLDPAIRTVIETGAPLTIVTLTADREMLLDQLFARIRMGNYVSWNQEKRFTVRFRRRLRRTLFSLILPKRAAIVSEEQMLLLKIYASDREFERSMTHWRGFVEKLAAERNNVRLLYVTSRRGLNFGIARC
jgi:hypothetical protein